jgi:hypothetical protein
MSSGGGGKLFAPYIAATMSPSPCTFPNSKKAVSISSSLLASLVF